MNWILLQWTTIKEPPAMVVEMKVTGRESCAGKMLIFKKEMTLRREKDPPVAFVEIVGLTRTTLC